MGGMPPDGVGALPVVGGRVPPAEGGRAPLAAGVPGPAEVGRRPLPGFIGVTGFLAGSGDAGLGVWVSVLDMSVLVYGIPGVLVKADGRRPVGGRLNEN